MFFLFFKYIICFIFLLLINIFPTILYLSFLKAKGNSRHPLCNPGLSKNFLEIKIKLALLKQKFLFPKNHDIFSLITKINLIKKSKDIKEKIITK